MQKKVFLSCSSRDQEIALTICRALEARGHPCWMSSRDVMPGENFQGAIVRAIRSAGVMVMVFSANANNSDEIKKEIALAGQTKLMVIPVRVEDVTPSEDFSYELATRQWVDLFRNWEFALDQLGRQIDYVIPKEAPEPAPSVAALQPPPVPPQTRAPESAPPKQTPDSVAPARTALMAGNRKPLAIAAGLLLLIGAGVAGFVFWKSNAPPTTMTVFGASPVKAALLPVSQKTTGNNSAPAKATPAAKAEQAQPILNPLVQKAVDAARAAERQARAAQAKARAVAQQAEAAAKQAEAGAAGSCGNFRYDCRDVHSVRGESAQPHYRNALLAAIWLCATLGVIFKLAFPRRFERLSVAFYLVMGWMLVAVIKPLSASVASVDLWLLMAGGLVCSAGMVFFLIECIPYHKAIWHGFVLAAVTLHFAAVMHEFAA